MVKFRGRKTIWIGPIFIILTQRGFSSWGIGIGKFRHNFTRSTSSLDTPGFGSLHHQHRRRNPR